MIFRSLPERLSEAEIDEMLEAADTDGELWWIVLKTLMVMMNCDERIKTLMVMMNCDENIDGDDELWWIMTKTIMINWDVG